MTQRRGISRMKRQLIWLCLMLALAQAPAAAQAEAMQSGAFRNGGTWAIDAEGVMTISGKARVDDGQISGTGLQGLVRKVIYGAEVAYIAPGQFSYCDALEAFEVDPGNEKYVSVDGVVYDKALTTVIDCPAGKTGDLALPDSVKSIGESAFANSRLDSVRLPEGLHEVQTNGFFDCHLTKIELPASFRVIGNSAFSACRELQDFRVAPENEWYKSVDGVLFSKDGLELAAFPGGRMGEYEVPEGTMTIGSLAFRSADALETVTLPDSLRHIRSSAFAFSGIETINLPEKLNEIEYEAFHGCHRLQTINYAGTKARWEKLPVGRDNDPLVFRTIHCQDGDWVPEPISGEAGDDIRYTLTPDGQLTVSGTGALETFVFSGNDFIVDAVLEPGITEISDGAFAWARNMKSIVLPDTVERIGYDAFYDCASLENLAIPVGVTFIDDEALMYNDSLTQIEYGGTMEQWQALTEDAEIYDAGYVTVHCADGDIEAAAWDYEPGGCGDAAVYAFFTDGDMDEDAPPYMVIEGEGSIWPYNFKGWRHINAIIIEDGIEGIGESAFANMPDLTWISIPRTLTAIGDGAFDGDVELNCVDFEGTLEQWQAVEIGENNAALYGAEINCFMGG